MTTFNPLFQSGPVDTTGLAGLPDLTLLPVFTGHKAATLQLAIDELNGDLPWTGNVSGAEDLDQEGRDALTADLTAAQDEAATAYEDVTGVAPGVQAQDVEEGSPQALAQSGGIAALSAGDEPETKPASKSSSKSK